jgi:ribonuclease P protein component
VRGSRPDGRGFAPLRRRADFERLYRRGRRRRIGQLVVISAPSQSGATEVGFVTGRRIGGAVQRNRAKRRLREAAARVPLPAGTAFIVVALPGVNEAGFDELVGWLAAAVKNGA